MESPLWIYEMVAVCAALVVAIGLVKLAAWWAGRKTDAERNEFRQAARRWEE